MKLKIAIFLALIAILPLASGVLAPYCYQESANVSTTCGGLSTGTYTVSTPSSWSNPQNTYDGDFGTFGESTSGIQDLDIRYYKPFGANNLSLWRIKDQNDTSQQSIDQLCWDAQATYIEFRARSNNANYVDWFCVNSTGTHRIERDTTSDRIYEEAMNWSLGERVETILSSPADGGAGESSTTFIAIHNSTPTIFMENATYFLWFSNGTLLNETLVDLSGQDQITNLTISGLNDGTYHWNVLTVGNDSSTVYSAFQQTNNSFTVGFTENSQTFASSVYDTSTQAFAINISYNSSFFPSISGKLVYNGTEYLGTTADTGDTVVFNTTVDIPVVPSTQNHTFYWVFTMTNGVGSLVYNSTFNNQTVNPIDFLQCGAGSTAVNYTIRDEVTNLLLNSTFQATFDYKLNLTSSVSKQLSVDLAGLSSYDFCINVDLPFHVNAEIDIDGNEPNETYEARKYDLAFEVYDNDTTTRDLYLLNETDARSIIFEVKDEGLSPLEGYNVVIYRNQPATGNKIVVEEDLTNNFGQVVAYLVEEKVNYDFEIYDTNNNLVKSINETNIACKATICIIPLVVTTETDEFGRFSDIDDHVCNLYFVEATNTFTLSWNDLTGDTSPAHRLFVERIAFNGSTSVCSNSSSITTSSVTCGVPSATASYSAQAFRTVSGVETRILCTGSEYGTLDIKVGDLTDTFGLEGYVWAFILLFSLILIGLWSPVVGIVLYMFGIIILAVTQIVYINPAIAIAQLVIGGLLIWALRQ